jgi:hypothetical protein
LHLYLIIISYTSAYLTIFKVKSNCVGDGYEKDPLFVHGIYVDYPISNDCVVSVMNASDLFNKFNDDDIENLY